MQVISAQRLLIGWLIAILLLVVVRPQGHCFSALLLLPNAASPPPHTHSTQILHAGYLAKHFGWQWGMMAPGLFGLAAGVVLLFALADKPEDTGAAPGSGWHLLFMFDFALVHIGLTTSTTIQWNCGMLLPCVTPKSPACMPPCALLDVAS